MKKDTTKRHDRRQSGEFDNKIYDPNVPGKSFSAVL